MVYMQAKLKETSLENVHVHKISKLQSHTEPRVLALLLFSVKTASYLSP